MPLLLTQDLGQLALALKSECPCLQTGIVILPRVGKKMEQVKQTKYPEQHDAVIIQNFHI